MSVFDRPNLAPADARRVAAWRWADAEYLARSPLPVHTNGAMYFAGLHIELLMKALLLEKHSWLSGLPGGGSPTNRRLFDLVYRYHDLEGLLAELPEVFDRIERFSQRDPATLQRMLKQVCGEWTIHVRYAKTLAGPEEAAEFLARVKELAPCLKSPLHS